MAVPYAPYNCRIAKVFFCFLFPTFCSIQSFHFSKYRCSSMLCQKYKAQSLFQGSALYIIETHVTWAMYHKPISYRKSEIFLDKMLMRARVFKLTHPNLPVFFTLDCSLCLFSYFLLHFGFAASRKAEIYHRRSIRDCSICVNIQ